MVGGQAWPHVQSLVSSVKEWTVLGQWKQGRRKGAAVHPRCHAWGVCVTPPRADWRGGTGNLGRWIFVIGPTVVAKI